MRLRITYFVSQLKLAVLPGSVERYNNDLTAVLSLQELADDW